MKKLIIVAVLAFVSFTISAQEGIKVGAFAGLPTGDASDISSFGFGLEAKYFFNVSDGFDVGVATGYTNFITKDIEFQGSSIEVDNVQFIPLAASGQYEFADKFSGVLDLGYAIGINDGNDGGFYYRPGIAYDISEDIEIGLSYSGVSVDSITWSSINLGVLFNL